MVFSTISQVAFYFEELIAWLLVNLVLHHGLPWGGLVFQPLWPLLHPISSDLTNRHAEVVWLFGAHFILGLGDPGL